MPKFDGIRGLCAVALLVVHVAWTASLTGSYNEAPSNLPAATVINGFQITVGVFFLLSGLFLYRPFARAIITDTPKPELGPYFLRRVLRLLPAYYVVTAVALLALNFNSIDGIWYVLRPVLLMQNYDPQWMAGMDITWTVPTEIQWYIVLPLIAWASHWYARRGADPVSRARRLMIPIPILILVGFAWNVYIHQPFMGIFPPEFWWPIGVAANIAAGMGLGIMSALSQVSPGNTSRIFRVAAKHPNMFWFAALIVFAINCAKPFGRPGYGDYDSLPGALTFYVLFILFCALLITPMVAPNSESRLIDAVVGNRVVVFLGRISYGVYLWHFIVMNLYLGSGSIFGGDPLQVPAMRGMAGFWELESAVLLGSIVVATVSYYAIERPLLQLGERWISSRKARKSTTTGTDTDTGTGTVQRVSDSAAAV
ncbi:acyltransferase family protein [Streptosporangium sp. CA-135522]|uniref:acyltransferase family protein n=1 Tax=Streptosporangium sp. CA-135522 TaxID=3240072 RepID=UPI003D8D7CDD